MGGWVGAVQAQESWLVLNVAPEAGRYSVSERLGFCFLRVPPAQGGGQVGRGMMGREPSSRSRCSLMAGSLRASNHFTSTAQLAASKVAPHAAAGAAPSPEGRGLAVRLWPLEAAGPAVAEGTGGAASAAAAAAAALSRVAAAGSGGACSMRTSAGGRAARLLVACPPLPRPLGAPRSRDSVVEATRGGAGRPAPGCSSAAQAGSAPASCRRVAGVGRVAVELSVFGLKENPAEPTHW